MMRQTAGTIIARVFITAMNLLVMMLAGHRLGASGLGDISLIVLGITLIMVMGNLVSGAAVVYLAPRVRIGMILLPSYLWSVITMGAAYAFLFFIPLVPAPYVVPVVLLAGIQCAYSAQLNILLGHERIKAFNLISAVQAFILIITFLILTGPVAVADRGGNIMAFVDASFTAFVATLFLSAMALFFKPRAAEARHEQVSVMRTMMRQGGMIQMANGLQLLTYRLGYWLIEHFRGTALLGVFAVGNQLAESAWLAPRSLGTVLYSRVSNTTDADRQRELTILSFKVSVFFAMTVVTVLCLLPAVVISTLFGAEVVGLSPVLWILAPGIVAMAASQSFSHFFSGTARNVHNMAGSGIALMITAIVGLLAIPAMGITGAALAASLAYMANGTYQAVVFLRVTGAGVSALLPHAGDVHRLRNFWNDIMGR